MSDNDVCLYFMAISHPSQAARAMLELKHVKYRVVTVLPLNQRVQLRLAGFLGGTVPALRVDGQRIQGSREISRFLNERWPEPPLFGVGDEQRRRVEAAELWGERVLQPIPRRLARFGAARELEVRSGAIKSAGVPMADLVARLTGPVVAYYGRTIEADGRRATEGGVRADLATLPALLDEADRLLADGTLAVSPPNAATLQILSTVRALSAFVDLQPLIDERPCAHAAKELFPRYSGNFPAFLPEDWLAGY